MNYICLFVLILCTTLIVLSEKSKPCARGYDYTTAMRNVGEIGEVCAICRKKWMGFGRTDWKEGIYGCKKNMECIICDTDPDPRCRDPSEKLLERPDCEKKIEFSFTPRQ
ncbi:uncharacterized protein LOC128999536 [Macrosteles quadrilineatus]|uniref:uncharacterized protein LOC128999536 n=1 Tax=Macrosteles quadrilineatus TaxID=74068 RepID=UPI0023E1D55D|nr:uncharacterized protein LOC128999536 [Macrosteles quadrilineatus]